MTDEQRPNDETDQAVNQRRDDPADERFDDGTAVPKNTLTDEEMRTFEDRVLHHESEDDQQIDLRIPTPPAD